VSEPVISVSGLRKSYGELEAVCGIDLEVERGEVFAFLGPNGAGKTTTTEVLEGYRARSAGEVSVLGVDPGRPTREWRQRIGIVLQQCRMRPELTVRETLELYAGYYRAPREIPATIDQVGLGEKADVRARALSGGQLRRLDVGVALIGDPDLLFLEADEATLVNRFKETRRRHPLAPDGRVLDGIRAEREVLGPLRERADVVMNTDGLTGAMLRRRIVTEVLTPGSSAKLALTILTFGFKNGPPRDADLVFDVRFLPNPHYREDLRPLTGRDAEVVAHVEAGELASEYYKRLLPLLDFLIPAYVAEGKTHLTIAIGCTGGRHRSVTVADHVARHLAARDDVSARVMHRDVELS
jgi:RNase adaptor protein for sRNA GlmZ degradation